jgi:hypothetical protein
MLDGDDIHPKVEMRICHQQKFLHISIVITDQLRGVSVLISESPVIISFTTYNLKSAMIKRGHQTFHTYQIAATYILDKHKDNVMMSIHFCPCVHVHPQAEDQHDQQPSVRAYTIHIAHQHTN